MNANADRAIGTDRMRHTPKFSAIAQDDLRRIGEKYPSAVPFIRQKIDLLAGDPHNLARPGGFPHPMYPKFEFWGPPPDASDCFFVLLIRFLPSDVMEVVGIGMTEF